MNNTNNSNAPRRDVIELLTVAVEFCIFLEHAVERDRDDFVSTALKLLPLLYLKASLLPEPCSLSDEEPMDYVTEENYEIIRHNISYVMGSSDDYLDVFVEDMRYSDQPVLCTVSEQLADIYQDLKNFVSAYRDGSDNVRETALSLCRDNFAHYWGQRVVNVMRVLHDVCYNAPDED